LRSAGARGRGKKKNRPFSGEGQSLGKTLQSLEKRGASGKKVEGENRGGEKNGEGLKGRTMEITRGKYVVPRAQVSKYSNSTNPHTGITNKVVRGKGRGDVN